MAIHALLVLLFTSMAAAVDIYSSNIPLAKQATQLMLIWEAPQGTLNPLVEPLTPQAGRGAGISGNTNIKGSFKSVTTNGAGAGGVNKGDVALVSCDPTNSSFLTQDAVVDLILPKNPGAIVLYSLESAHCGARDVGTFAHYYTLRDVTADTVRMLASSTASANATIRADTAGTDTQPTSRNQTPAVAMSVLYAVTGIVTVLFLVIITTGAWRAHNNPARYGPRTGFAGRPRQSRAKGLAKAMLETLPIVKFGDPLPPKAENRDIELDDTNTEEPKSTVHAATDSNKANPQTDPVPVASDTATSAPKSTEVGSASQADAETPNEHLGCSICTEDFTKGEDVRVLPCNHQYHPACIDPWLLNVSGTCPLCRVDLRPVRSNLSAGERSSPTDADPTPAVPAEAVVHHSRVQRILATRHAPVHERIAILRQLARESGQQQPTEPAASSASAADGSRNRLSLADRLRERFSVRTRSSNAQHQTSAPTTSATETTANTTATRSSAPGTNATNDEAPPRP